MPASVMLFKSAFAVSSWLISMAAGIGIAETRNAGQSSALPAFCMILSFLLLATAVMF